MAELNPSKIAQEQLDAAAERLGLDPATRPNSSDGLRGNSSRPSLFRWTMERSRFITATGFSITMPAGRPREA